MNFNMALCYPVGAALTFFGVCGIVQTLHERKTCTMECTAEVVDYEVKQQPGSRGGAPRNHYFPILSYRAEGREFRKSGPVGSVTREYPVGTLLDIRYDPDNPESFILPGAKGVLLLCALPVLMGIGILTLAVLCTLGIVSL